MDNNIIISNNEISEDEEDKDKKNYILRQRKTAVIF